MPIVYGEEESSSRSNPWILESSTGSGGFGVVSVWRHVDRRDRIAVKRCRLPSNRISSKQKELWDNEVKIMLELDHPNVVKSFPLPDGFLRSEQSGGLPLLFMEFCSQGDLRQILNNPQNACGLEESRVLSIVSDLTSALGYLHNRRIIHRDLKPENVVLNLENERTVYKLIDLGYAKKLDQSSLAQTIVGTLQYLAPEFYMGNRYTKSVDYWSLGLITHEIVTGVRPFLPDYPPGKWMEVVENKDRQTICIPDLNEKRSTFFNENRISDSLQTDISIWLQSLLEWDSNLRGKNDVSDEITVFSELKDILSRKRLKIYSLDKSQNQLDYLIQNETVDTLGAFLENRMGILRQNQLILTSNGNKLLSFEPFFNGEGTSYSVYVVDMRKVENVKKKITEYGLQIPETVKGSLTSPREKVEFKVKRKIYSHSFHFVRQEVSNNENLVYGLQVLIRYLLNELKEMNNFSQVLAKLFGNALAKFELFQDSLHYDIEKYKDQSQKKHRITSAKTLESWQRPDPDLHKQIKFLEEEIHSFDKETKTINSNFKEFQKSPDYSLKGSTEMKELTSKSLKLCESLRQLSAVNGRRPESTNVVEMARIIAICLKRRDENLHKHFQLLEKLVNFVNRIGIILPRLEVCKQQLEIFINAISRSQRKRQSDVWRLLSAALQSSPSEKSTPTMSPHSAGAMGPFLMDIDDSSRLTAENLMLQTNLQRSLEDTVHSVDKLKKDFKIN